MHDSRPLARLQVLLQLVSPLLRLVRFFLDSLFTLLFLSSLCCRYPCTPPSRCVKCPLPCIRSTIPIPIHTPASLEGPSSGLTLTTRPPPSAPLLLSTEPATLQHINFLLHHRGNLLAASAFTGSAHRLRSAQHTSSTTPYTPRPYVLTPHLAPVDVQRSHGVPVSASVLVAEEWAYTEREVRSRLVGQRRHHGYTLEPIRPAPVGCLALVLGGGGADHRQIQALRKYWQGQLCGGLPRHPHRTCTALGLMRCEMKGS